MKKFIIFFLFLMILNVLKTYGQNEFKQGRVIDYDSENAIKDITVELYINENLIYSYKTDLLGKFQIPKSIYQIGLKIKFKSINYEVFDLEVKDIKDLNETIIIKLKRISINLKEVIIRAQKRYIDTIRIDLSKESFERSYMIEDFLNTRGFSKATDGTIYYKGKAINEFKINGKEFFKNDKNNIYKLLPTLIINDIEIIQSNVDSLTNTILQEPTIKINAKLKEKYMSGKFGNVNLGFGTLKRFILNGNFFLYRKNEQISLSQNFNNVNNISTEEPSLIFLPNGNDNNTQITKINYSNTFFKKIQFDFASNIKTNIFKTSIGSYRNDQNISQESILKSNSYHKQIQIENLELNFNYKIDSINNFKSKHQFISSSNKYIDTNFFYFNNNDNIIQSSLIKKRRTLSSGFINDFTFHSFSKYKKGRYKTFDFSTSTQSYNNTENNEIYESSYKSINIERSASENIFLFKTSITEPLNSKSFIRSLFLLKKAFINESDENWVNKINNNLAQFGFNYQSNINKHNITASYIFDVFEQNYSLNKSYLNTYSSNITIMANFNLKDNNKFNINYTQQPNYPTIFQLTNINNSFDLISQYIGNNNLIPEIKKELELTLNLSSKTKQSYIFSVSYSKFKYKFGYKVDTVGNSQISSIENLSNTNEGKVSLSIPNFGFNKFKLNYNFNLLYTEIPIKVNGNLLNNKGIIFNNTFFSNLKLFNKLTVNPTLSLNYSESSYAKNKIKLLSLNYSDKLSFSIVKFQFNILPSIIYNQGLSNQFNWAANCEVKKSLLKSYGSIWLQVYDVFNSFKYINNVFAPGYTQTLNYTNLRQYALLGLTFKFNNMYK